MKLQWPKGPTEWITNETLHVSIPFTWNIPQVVERVRQRCFQWDSVIVGGPATVLLPRAFDDQPWVRVGDTHPGVLQKVNPMATRTTVGCVNRCPFCAVPVIEPTWAELDDWPDLPVLLDNNLLAASDTHFDRVMDRLERWGWCDFNQGLDCRLMTEHHAERIGRIRGAIVRLSLDSLREADLWQRAFELLRRFGTAKRRVRAYVLCGFDSGPADAWRRCEIAEAAGAMPLPQWYHALTAIRLNEVTDEQRRLGWDKNSRTQIMRRFYWHSDGRRIRRERPAMEAACP